MNTLNWLQVDGYPGAYYLNGGITLFGIQFHAEAIEVQRPTAQNYQRASHPENVSTYHSLEALTEGSGPFETIEVNGKACVVYLTPYTR